jgi:hypothetical protein
MAIRLLLSELLLSELLLSELLLSELLLSGHSDLRIVKETEGLEDGGVRLGNWGPG